LSQSQYSHSKRFTVKEKFYLPPSVDRQDKFLNNMATTISGTVDREKMPPNVPQSNGGPGPKMGCPHKAAGIAPPRGPYTAHSPARRRLILGLVTIAGFLGPLSLTIDLPGLPTQATLLRTSISEINATIAVFQAVLAVAVRMPFFSFHHTLQAISTSDKK
jgi:hypothetical protein